MRKGAHVPSNGGRIDHFEGASAEIVHAGSFPINMQHRHVADRSKHGAEMTRRLTFKT